MILLSLCGLISQRQRPKINIFLCRTEGQPEIIDITVYILQRCFQLPKKFLQEYKTEGDISATIIKAFLVKNEKKIVERCQAYLDEYADNQCPLYSTNLDLLLLTLQQP